MSGSKNGDAKEYYDNGDLQFEGSYFWGKRCGKGKEYYYENGKLKRRNWLYIAYGRC